MQSQMQPNMYSNTQMMMNPPQQQQQMGGGYQQQGYNQGYGGAPTGESMGCLLYTSPSPRDRG